jgi:hypothetical protein
MVGDGDKLVVSFNRKNGQHELNCLHKYFLLAEVNIGDQISEFVDFSLFEFEVGLDMQQYVASLQKHVFVGLGYERLSVFVEFGNLDGYFADLG